MQFLLVLRSDLQKLERNIQSVQHRQKCSAVAGLLALTMSNTRTLLLNILPPQTCQSIVAVFDRWSIRSVPSIFHLLSSLDHLDPRWDLSTWPLLIKLSRGHVSDRAHIDR